MLAIVAARFRFHFSKSKVKNGNSPLRVIGGGRKCRGSGRIPVSLPFAHVRRIFSRNLNAVYPPRTMFSIFSATSRPMKSLKSLITRPPRPLAAEMLHNQRHRACHCSVKGVKCTINDVTCHAFGGDVATRSPPSRRGDSCELSGTETRSYRRFRESMLFAKVRLGRRTLRFGKPVTR